MADPEMQRDFVARGGEKVRKSKPPPKPLSRGKGLKAESDAQKIRNAFLAGVKAERIRAGGKRCEGCDRVTQPLDLHHILKRSKAQGYRPGTPGADDPSLLLLLCRPCHRRIERNSPEWSESA